jgi:hypothetical protein
MPKRWNCGLLVVTHGVSMADRPGGHLVLRQGNFRVAERAAGAI